MNKLLAGMLLPLLFAAALPPALAAEQGAPAAAAARAPEDREQLERRLNSVATLLDKSSASKQIDASGNAEAIALRGKARGLRTEAETAYQAGRLADASRLLDQAARMMFESVRLAAPEQVTADKARRDFDNRLESVKALLSAQKRIAAEKKLGAKGAEATARIEAQIREATALAGGGKLAEGRTLLDQVYVATKTAIEGMRDGDTLVRSLSFATREEEYHYEIDRNETHRMLIKVLLEEKRAANPGLESMVQKYLEQSKALRASAEAAAKAKDYEGAIRLLEDSTKELVRAIRGAGVYIPG